MPTESYRDFRIIIILLLVVGIAFPAFAQLEALKEQAKDYRENGLLAQGTGDFDLALSYYQKAIKLDPGYAAAYNDLAVMYDIKGAKDKAEKNYLKCIQIEPNFKSAYFNLANLYEEKGDFRKAAKFWQKRIDMGQAGDLWTEKAKQRIQNIAKLDREVESQLEARETMELMIAFSGKKEEDFDEDAMKKEEAGRFLGKAKMNYSQGNYAASLKNISTAQYLDPTNKEIEEFAKRVRIKLGAYSQ